MTEWEQFELGDVADFINGGAWSDQEYAEMGIAVARVSDFVGNTIDLTQCKFLPTASYERYKKHKITQGDLVLSTVGSHPSQPKSMVGRPVVVPQSADGAFLNQNAVCLRPSSAILDARYLAYFGQSFLFRQYILNHARGTANQIRIAIGELKEMTIHIPNLNVQRKIAAILSAYDDLIENNSRRIALLEKMAEETYREWFVRLRFPGHERVAMRQGIPDGWEIKPLGDIANILMGQSPSSEFYNEDGIGLPFHQGVGTYGGRFPRQQVFSTEAKRKAKKGDILFSVRAPVGRINIADCDLIIGRGLAAINHREGCNSYLLYLLKSAFASEDLIGNGSIFVSVGKDELNAVKGLTPPAKLIERFNAFSSEIDAQIETLHRQSEILRKTRDMLLPRLLSGKIDVENLDIQFPVCLTAAE